MNKLSCLRRYKLKMYVQMSVEFNTPLARNGTKEEIIYISFILKDELVKKYGKDLTQYILFCIYVEDIFQAKKMLEENYNEGEELACQSC